MCWPTNDYLNQSADKLTETTVAPFVFVGGHLQVTNDSVSFSGASGDYGSDIFFSDSNAIAAYVASVCGIEITAGEKKFYIMAQGRCVAKMYDGTNWYEIELNGPGDALELKSDMWREFVDFSENSVMFTLCNMHYDKSKYILDLKEYDEYIKNLKSDG
jgi:hypothetical protein